MKNIKEEVRGGKEEVAGIKDIMRKSGSPLFGAKEGGK